MVGAVTAKRKSGWSSLWRAQYEARTRVLHTRCDPETKDEVVEYARATKRSIGEAIRQLVEIGLEAERAGAVDVPGQVAAARQRGTDPRDRPPLAAQHRPGHR
jgi:hypothetical protein